MAGYKEELSIHKTGSRCRDRRVYEGEERSKTVRVYRTHQFWHGRVVVLLMLIGEKNSLCKR